MLNATVIEHSDHYFSLVSNTSDHLGVAAQASKRRENHEMVLLTETAANIDRRFTASGSVMSSIQRVDHLQTLSMHYIAGIHS